MRDPVFLEQPEHRNKKPARSGPFQILNGLYKNKLLVLFAGDQQRFVVLLLGCGTKKRGGNARHGLVGLRRGNARHRPKHAATHLSPAGPPEAHAEVLFRRRQQAKFAPVLERPSRGYVKSSEYSFQSKEPNPQQAEQGHAKIQQCV